MAKAKKKELSLEEKLEQVLVPVDEQPYEVPDNWCWIHLLDAFDNLTDSKKKLATKEYLEEGMYSVVDQGQEFVGGYTDKEDMLYSGELPVVIFGDHTRCIKYVDFPFVQGADGVKILRCKQFWDSKAFYYALKSVEIPNLGYRRHYPLFKELCIPVPPLAEQQRIVEQIESLFAKLDEAKEKVQAVADGYEDRVSLIYHAAFKGNYTANWRNQKGITMDATWETVISQDVCEPITCGKTPKEYIADTGEIPYLKVYNIVDNQIDFVKTPQFIPRDIHEGKLKSSMLKSGDVVMNIVGPPLRKVAIIPDDHPEWNMNQAIVRFRPKKDKMLSRFLYYVLLNPETLEEVISQTRGVVGQANISVSQSRNLELPCPSLEEQQEIVNILDSLLYKEKVVLEKANNIIDLIDTMKKSLLADAFRGKLGTNIMTEESSLNLLRDIFTKEEE